MSPPASGTPGALQPPVAERDLEAEVIHCVEGVVSPLLANIALSALDDHFTRQWHELMGARWQREKRRRKGLGTWRLVRYADDWAVMVNGTRAHAEALREEAAAVLAPLGLRLAEEKTRVVHIDEGFDFLSFTIRRMRKRGTAKHYVYTVPSRTAIQAVKDKISARTYRSTRHLDPAMLIQGINRTLAGSPGVASPLHDVA
jgi:RNA-directed DNA polymerase